MVALQFLVLPDQVRVLVRQQNVIIRNWHTVSYVFCFMCPHNICATFLPSLVLLPKNNSKTCLIFRLQTTLKSLLFMNPFLLIKKNPKLSDNLSIHVRNHKNNIFRNLTLEFLLFHLKMSSNLPELVGGFIPEYAKVQPAFIRTLAAKLTQGRYPVNPTML